MPVIVMSFAGADGWLPTASARGWAQNGTRLLVSDQDLYIAVGISPSVLTVVLSRVHPGLIRLVIVPWSAPVSTAAWHLGLFRNFRAWCYPATPKHPSTTFHDTSQRLRYCPRGRLQNCDSPERRQIALGHGGVPHEMQQVGVTTTVTRKHTHMYKSNRCTPVPHPHTYVSAHAFALLGTITHRHTLCWYKSLTPIPIEHATRTLAGCPERAQEIPVLCQDTTGCGTSTTGEYTIVARGGLLMYPKMMSQIVALLCDNR